jgi:general secretion pathway protein I
MQIFSSGVRSATLNEEYIKAAMLADARLQAVGVGQTLQEGLFEGVEDDRYHWRVEVSPYVDEALPAGGNSASAFHVKVAVWWEDAGRTRRVELNSMRLGQP